MSGILKARRWKETGLMLSFSELLEKAEPQTHMVSLYGADEDLLFDNVTRYIQDGLEKNESVIVIASAQHISTFSQRLEEAGTSARRVNFLDADAMLSLFMLAGQPDMDRFDATVGEMLRTIARKTGGGGVRAYGEMVGILWKAGQFSAAIRLEQLWNELLNSVVFNLFCAYPIDVFSAEFQSGAVDELLCAHTHMVPAVTKGDLQSALNRAMDDVLGAKVVELRPLMKSAGRPAWADVPKAEATILWLRTNLPHYAESILDRAKQYYDAGQGNVAS